MSQFGSAHGHIVFLNEADALEAAEAKVGYRGPVSIRDLIVSMCGDDGDWVADDFWVSGKISADTDEMLNAIAPFVQAGSSIEWTVEEELSRQIFDGEAVVSITPIITWPDVPLKVTPRQRVITEVEEDSEPR